MRALPVTIVLLFWTTPVCAQQSVQSMALYRSIEDPAGQQPRRVLVDDSVLKFGQARDDRESLLRSDLGGPLHFLKVDGGVRVRGQPILFPTRPRDQMDLEDFSCTALGSAEDLEVLCRSKANARLYRSRLVRGGMVSFEMNCFDEITNVCHYQLVSGPPIRPTHIQEQ